MYVYMHTYIDIYDTYTYIIPFQTTQKEIRHRQMNTKADTPLQINQETHTEIPTIIDNY